MLTTETDIYALPPTVGTGAGTDNLGPLRAVFCEPPGVINLFDRTFVILTKLGDLAPYILHT